MKFRALIGHGAGYGVADKLYDTIGKDADHIYNVDPVSIWLLSPKSLAPGLPAITKMVGEEYIARPDTKVKSAHVGMAASNSYVFTDVLPRAIKIRYRCESLLEKLLLIQILLQVEPYLGMSHKFPKSGENDMIGQNILAAPVECNTSIEKFM